MERYSQCRRSELPYGKAAEAYWKKYIDDLMAEVKFYDYEDEKHTKYRPKGITDPEEAFVFKRNLMPKEKVGGKATDDGKQHHKGG